MEYSQETAASTAEATNTVVPTSNGLPPETELARRILETYSGIAPKDVPGVICEIVSCFPKFLASSLVRIYHLPTRCEQTASQGLCHFPYGCFQLFQFLNLASTLADTRYQDVLERLRAPDSTETFLDVGCALGTVVRLLASQGVPDDRLYGTDLQAGLLDLGYELFGDRTWSRATYVAGDMLGEDHKTRLDDRLGGKIDIIYASAFFHLFEREGQLKAAKRMVGFLRPENPGVMIFGQNQGPKINGWEKYVLDPKSWKDLWEEVGQATGTRWRTEMDVDSSDEWNHVRFGVYRVF
ncbi:uncharacterized protein PG998_009048 [Apiospora kogelbergensis]|uniref:uncharacterized protein n=1 Tax=Apiospora kogelbergensis TaxID=1337665 RepID=UPI003130A229